MPQFADYITEGLDFPGYSPLLASVLRARGADSPARAQAYLSRGEELLSDPFLLKDMDRAVARLKEAIRRQERLAVYGDYDVDGITSACLLTSYFESRGLHCEIYIPDRLDEGYGINTQAIDRLKERGVSLIVSVDCGITALAETEHAKSLGMDIIITDHHQCPPLLPQAVAVVNPKRPDSAYPFPELAGVGVAFKLVCALEGESAGPLSRYADLVAVGTIADVMPLVGENRYLTYIGLEQLKNAPSPGMAALLEEAGALKKPVTASTVSFGLAPRINAAGRLSQTETALQLLLSQDREEAAALSKELCSLNRRRQELEMEVLEAAFDALGAERPASPIVLESERWHPGVVGIAASRLTEEFKLPAVMICVDEENGKGSCRSYGDFNLFEALSACSEHLESFGGHAFAAGLNIKPENIDAFRAALAAYYSQNPSTVSASLEPELLILEPSVLDMAGVESLSALEPCGSGNPQALFCMTNALLESVTPIGGGRHLRLRLQKKGMGFDCVYFSHGEESLPLREGERADFCFAAQVNEFRGQRNVQLIISDICKTETPALCRQILEEPQPETEELRPYRPSRAELGSLWRRMRGRGELQLFSEALEEDYPLGLEPVKLALGLRIFSELGLLQLRQAEGSLRCCLDEAAAKTELDCSPLFRRLWQTEKA